MLSSVLTVLLAVMGAGFPQAGDSHAAVVSGRVVDAVSGRPIPGAVVTPAGSAVAATADSPPPRALTNGQGEFVLRGLRKGTVFFTATKSGYADATYNQRRPGGSGQGLAIDSGQRLNAVEIRMWRHASITGTVVDEAGEPAVGVRVRAFGRGFIAGRKRYTPSRAATTDDRGVYRIADLTPGEYTVGIISTQTAIPNEVMDVFFGPSGGGSDRRRREVGAELNAIGSAIVPVGSQYAIGVGDQTFTLPPGTLMPQPQPHGGVAVYPTLFYPSSPTLAQASAITLHSGEERSSVDLQVQPTRTTRVSGVVMGPEGPADTVGVRLIPAGADDLVEPIEVAKTVTNSSGGFTYPAVPPGPYVISVLRLPRPPPDLSDMIMVTPGGGVTIGTAVPPATAGPPPPPPVPADATLYAQVPIGVGEAELAGIVIALGAGPRVTGRVEFEGTGEKPTDGMLTGLRINLDPADGSRWADATLSDRAGHPDDDGRFRTFGVAPGKYVLRVSTPAGWFLKGAFLGTTDLTDVAFDLSSKDLSGVVITYTDRPASLSGNVRTSQGADPGAVVLAFPTDSSAWGGRGAFPRRMRTARADKDGSYSFTALAPGEYYVVAVDESGFADWQDPALLEALTRVSQQIRIVDGEHREQTLTTAVIK